MNTLSVHPCTLPTDTIIDSIIMINMPLKQTYEVARAAIPCLYNNYMFLSLNRNWVIIIIMNKLRWQAVSASSTKKQGAESSILKNYNSIKPAIIIDLSTYYTLFVCNVIIHSWTHWMHGHDIILLCRYHCILLLSSNISEGVGITSIRYPSYIMHNTHTFILHRKN